MLLAEDFHVAFVSSQIGRLEMEFHLWENEAIWSVCAQQIHYTGEREEQQLRSAEEIPGPL